MCHQYPANVLSLPPIPGGYTSPGALAQGLNTLNYTNTVVQPKDKNNVGPLPPYTVVQLGDHHVGIVGPDGKIYDWTM
ncbi:MAG: hypothetical protein AAGU11_07535, partial [Syntrophobacteraceae bacterium]